MRQTKASPALQQAIEDGPMAPILFDYVTAGHADGIKFDTWYCTEHLAALATALPGAQMRRYAVPSKSSYLVVADLAALPEGGATPLGAGDLPASVAHHEQFLGEAVGCKRRRDATDAAIENAVVYPAFLRVPEASMEEIGVWYDTEHLPMLMESPQWVMTRRFRVRAAHGLDWTHVALHYLADLRALTSEARLKARDTPWRDALIAEGWFAPEYRVCYRAQDF